MPTVITSRQHPIVKEFRELARGGGPLMLLDGWHLLGEAAAAKLAVEKIAICGPPTAGEQDVIDRLRAFGRRDRGSVGRGAERAVARELAHRCRRQRATAVG